jgi:hypothetical protein
MKLLINFNVRMDTIIAGYFVHYIGVGVKTKDLVGRKILVGAVGPEAHTPTIIRLPC